MRYLEKHKIVKGAFWIAARWWQKRHNRHIKLEFLPQKSQFFVGIKINGF